MSADAPAATPQANVWRLDIEDENGVEALAGEIAALAQAGDLITLSGDLGAGKTTLARALIRRLCADPALEVPSPTFTLMQIYDGVHFPIVHADLYRVQSSGELAELGWEEAAEGALVLVEWADRMGDTIAPDRLDVAMRLDASRGETYREVVLTGHGAFAERLQRARALAHLLAASGWGEATRTFMLGDASVRAYERLQKPDGERAILMISPPRPDGPPVRYGKPYSAIARLAETITPFIAMAQALGAKGLSAPKILASDIAAGLAIIEDLGTEGVVEDGAPIPERYREATTILAFLHSTDTPRTIPGPGGDSYSIPPYDLDALLIEVELLVEWYAPHIGGVKLSSAAKAIFLSLWRSTLTDIANARSTWVLRDYHSPNLIWLPGAAGAGAGRHHRLPGLRARPSRLRCRLPAAGRARQRARRSRASPALPLRAHARQGGPRFRDVRFRRRLRGPGGAARHQGARHLHAPRPARRQARLPRPHPARRALAGQEPRTSGACGDQRLV